MEEEIIWYGVLIGFFIVLILYALYHITRAEIYIAKYPEYKKNVALYAIYKKLRIFVILGWLSAVLGVVGGGLAVFYGGAELLMYAPLLIKGSLVVIGIILFIMGWLSISASIEINSSGLANSDADIKEAYGYAKKASIFIVGVGGGIFIGLLYFLSHIKKEKAQEKADKEAEVTTTTKTPATLTDQVKSVASKVNITDLASAYAAYGEAII